MSASADLELMRATVLLDADPAAAARRAGDILAKWPGHPEAALLLATACSRLGDAGQALATLEPLAGAQPDSPVLQLEVGRAYAAAGRRGEALAAFRRVVTLDAAFADGWRELAAELFAAGDESGGDLADARYRQLVRDPAALADAAVALNENRLAAAGSMLRQHLARWPRDEVALRLYGQAAVRSADHAEAERLLNASLAVAPGYALARYELARLLYLQQRTDEALPQIERVLRTEPDSIPYRSLKAQVLRLVGRNDEAIALMQGVVAADPGDPRGPVLLGHLLREVGQQAQAVASYRRALAVRPACGEAYWSLANLKTVRFSAEDLAAMRAQLAQSAVLGTDRIHLEFALGKALEDAGEYAESFGHYQQGNALYRATVEHSPDAVSADVRRSRAVYSAQFFAERAGWGSERRDPIFVVGLPRSGSTLLEQILGSHSAVEATRELPDVPAIALELIARAAGAGSAAYPEPVAAAGRAEIEAAAARYLARTAAHRPLGRARFVDKMLGNFGHVGLIHLMFPQAAIIDVRRHPLGCGFSCFKQLFSRGVNFSYDLGEIGRYYRDYVELMEHMDAVLPGRVHRVYYERLVADPETEVRRLLDYCGLPFEADCLRFYDNKRVVLTVSSEQVRQPIYAEGVGQWRHYEPWLGPLAEALGDLVARYPA